jgi:hypothetical protein
MKRVTVSLIGLLMAAPLLGQEPVRERQHVVRTGDTLWDLAAFYFNDPFTWPTIYQANTDVVEDPHWIYPEEVLVIPGIAGDTEPEPRVAIRPADRPVRTVFYRPPPVVETARQASQATVLSEPSLERVPVRSGEFNSAPYVGSAGDLDVVGVFIRALRENRDVGGLPSAHPQDAVFLGYQGGRRPEVGTRLVLIEIGDRVRGTGGLRVLQPTGVVRITGLERDVMQGRIETQYAPIHRGQRAVPLAMYPDFVVEEARRIEDGDGYDLEGRVLEFLDDPPMPSRTDLGFVNLGADHGVNVGDIFTAFLPDRPSRERGTGDFLSRVERLPPEDVAWLRVVRVTGSVATVKVDRLMLPRLAAGIGVRRTHRVQ